jgi:hypothetical protein
MYVSEVVPVICGSLYGPHDPCAALVVQVEVGGELGVVAVELGEVGGELGVVAVELGEVGVEVEVTGPDVRVDVLVGVGLCQPDGHHDGAVGEDAVVDIGLHPATATKTAATLAAARMVRGQDSLVMGGCLPVRLLGRLRYGTHIRRFRRFTDNVGEFWVHRVSEAGRSCVSEA